MSLLPRLLLAICVFAGMANGVMHQGSHDSHDGCISGHSHSHNDTQDTHDEGDGKGTPHHHNCCHVPTAAFMTASDSPLLAFQPILVEIPTDVPLVPEEPVFALDKPPLI